jgi:hypothetical protein
VKVTPSDLDIIRGAVTPYDTEERRDRYRRGDFPRADAVQDLNKRYRWDLFYGTRAYLGVRGEYADAHFYTALKSVIPDL